MNISSYSATRLLSDAAVGIPRHRPKRLTPISDSNRPVLDRREEFLSMPVIVDKRHLLLLQRIVAAKGGLRKIDLRSEAIPASESVRVWLCAARHTLDGLMSAIMRDLPHAEFGRILSQ